MRYARRCWQAPRGPFPALIKEPTGHNRIIAGNWRGLYGRGLFSSTWRDGRSGGLRKRGVGGDNLMFVGYYLRSPGFVPGGPSGLQAQPLVARRRDWHRDRSGSTLPGKSLLLNLDLTGGRSGPHLGKRQGFEGGYDVSD